MCYRYKLRCKIPTLKGVYELSFLQCSQEDLEQEAKKSVINLKDLLPLQIIYRQPLYMYVLPYGPVSSLELLQFMCFALGNNQVWTILPKQHHQRIPGTLVSSPLQSCGIGHASVSLLCSGHYDYFVYIPWKPYCLCHNRKYLDPNQETCCITTAVLTPPSKRTWSQCPECSCQTSNLVFTLSFKL